ncbi:MAG TPA: hypothetical protein PLV68_04420, partial [Ilumatobacteraceae bacterium]|nr:hypothetical protein [Ilumatobacteraceae bacterium]
GDLTKRITIEHVNTGGPGVLNVQWAGPGVAQQYLPTSALRPAYGLVTRTTVHDSNPASPPQITHTEYTATGIDAALGMATRVTVDPAGARLTTTTGYETSGYRRRTSRTLPGGSATTYDYYAPSAGAAVNVPCTAWDDTTINQGGMLRKTTEPTAATGAAIISEAVYDSMGRQVATRVGTRSGGVDTWSSSWTCVTYDGRGRITQTVHAARGLLPGRTVTNSYSIGADPRVNSISDNVGTITTTTDLLGRTVTSTDVWGQTVANAYDQTTGRLTSTTDAAGVDGYTYTRDGRLVQQSFNGQPIATPSYLAPGNANEYQVDSVTYPGGGGNAGNATNGTFT